jgi:hypothetical protein
LPALQLEDAAESMTRLGDFSWWPTVWVDNRNLSFPLSQLRTKAVLTNVRRTGTDLVLFVEHDGLVCTGKISAPLSEDFLILLRHVLLQHWSEPLSAVEDVQVNFDSLALP